MINKNKIIYGTIILSLIISANIITITTKQHQKTKLVTKAIMNQGSVLEDQTDHESQKSSIAADNPTTTNIDSNTQVLSTNNHSNNSNYYNSQPITYSKDFANSPTLSPASAPSVKLNNIFNMKLYDLKTPSPIPIVDPPPIGWATGLATDMSSIISPTGSGAKLTGVPGTPFVNDVGGSTMMAELKFDNEAINTIKNNINTYQIKLSFEVMSDIRPIIDTSTTIGITDGWMFGLIQDLHDIGIGGFGDYSDDIHTPAYLNLGYRDLGPTQTNWVKHEFIVPNNINLDIPLQVMFLAEESSEPTTPQWTLMIRGLKVEAIKS